MIRQMTGPVRLRLLRALWVMLAVVVTTVAMAQAKFTINGRLKVEGAGLDGCRMVVYMDGEKHRTISTDLNRFSMEMELNKNYVLSFEKDGFVTKKLSFNTYVPATAAQIGFTPFDFVVSLFKQYDGMNTVVFNQPVGMIRYDAALVDFDYDTDYTKSIQSALEAAQAELDMKQKEEERELADARKRKDQEAKEKAKADARAAKEAATQAKAEAKQDAPIPEPAQAKAAPAVSEVPPPSKPEPAPVKPERKVPVAKPVRASMHSKPMEGAEQRRSSAPRMEEEHSPVEAAVPRKGVEPRPKFEPSPETVIRHHDVIVEPNEVVTVIKVQQGERSTEYRRVARKYSGVFYFKNGTSCSKLIYESEALAEN
ncbi:MAG: hypothetical protein WBB32_15095 [Flavobacteriales bacterium]|nr:hypothetical protein [Flavobacteriales bacterium]